MPSSWIYIYHITQVEGLKQNLNIYDVEKTDPAAPAEHVIKLVSPQPCIFVFLTFMDIIKNSAKFWRKS